MLEMCSYEVKHFMVDCSLYLSARNLSVLVPFRYALNSNVSLNMVNLSFGIFP